MTASITPENRNTGILCGLASALIWGAFPVITRQGITHAALDAYDITCIRYTVSGLILLPFLLRRGLMGLNWKAVALMVCGVGAPYMLVVAQGLSLAPVEQFAVITPGSMILLACLISAWRFGNRLSRRASGGILLILAGMLVAGWHSFASTQASPSAYLIFLFGGLLWAIYTVTARHCATSPLHATAVVSVFSMILYLPAYLGFRGLSLLQAQPWDIGVQVLYQGLLVSTVALFFYSKSVQILGAALGASFAALVPGSSILLAVLLLGERPSSSAILGLLVVSAGMLFTLLPSRPPARLNGRVARTETSAVPLTAKRPASPSTHASEHDA